MKAFSSIRPIPLALAAVLSKSARTRCRKCRRTPPHCAPLREPDLSSLSSEDSSAGSSGRGPLSLYTAAFDASWEIDLYGGTRRAVQAADAQADAVDADLADTQVSLAAEVAQAYIDLRDQQQRLAIAQRTADLQQKMLTLTEQRRAGGTTADVDVERLTTQVENTRSTLTPLAAQIEISLDQLAVLTGKAPGALDAELAAPQALPSLPANVSIGDPRDDDPAASGHPRGGAPSCIEQCRDRRAYRRLLPEAHALWRPQLYRR